EDYVQVALDEVKALLRANHRDPLLLFFRARLRYAIGEHDRAYGDLEWALRFTEETEEHRVLRAKLEWHRRNEPGAKRILDEILADDPAPPSVLAVVGTYRHLGQPEFALAAMETGRALHPLDLGLAVQHARLLTSQGDPRKAEEVLAEIPAAGRKNPRCALALAEAVMLLPGRLADAEAILTAAAADEEPGSDLALRLVDVLLDTGEQDPRLTARLGKAEKLLSAAIAAAVEGDPRWLYRTFLTGKLRFRQRRYEEAEDELSVVTSRRPDEPSTHLLLARVHEATAKYDTAALELSTVIRLTAPTPELLLERARVRLSGSSPNPVRARQDCLAALELSPESTEARLLLASAHRSLRTTEGLEEARTVLEEALAREGAGVRIRIMLGRVLMELGDFEAATEQLRLARELARTPREDLDATDALAALYDRMSGEDLSPGARDQFSRHFGSHPDHLEGFLRYAWLLLETGRSREARKWALRAAEQAPRRIDAKRLIFETCFPAADSEQTDRKLAGTLLDDVARLSPLSPAREYMEGRLLLADGDLASAADLLRRARQRSPLDHRIAYYSGLASHRAGDLEDARVALTRCIEIEPRNLSAHRLLALVAFTQGRRMLQEGSPSRAARQFQFALEQDPAHLPSRALLAEASFRAGVRGDRTVLAMSRKECEKLVEDLEQKGASLPKKMRADVLAPAYLLLGNICHSMQDWPQVIRYCDKYLEIHPDDPVSLHRKAIALIRWGQPALAVPVMERARTLAPESWQILFLLAVACVRAEMPERARVLVGSWLEDHPDHSFAWGALGWLRAVGGDGEAALDAYRRSLVTDPDNYASADALASLLFAREGEEKAVEALRRLREKTRFKAELTYLMARVRLAKDFRSEEGLGLLQKALRDGIELDDARIWCTVLLLRVLLDRDQAELAAREAARFRAWADDLGEFAVDALGLRLAVAEVYSLSGVALHQVGDFENSEHRYYKALELEPEYVPALNNLAELLACAPGYEGRVEEALKHARRATELAPDLPEVHDTLGIALLAAAETDGAIAAFEECLRLSRQAQAADSTGAGPDRARKLQARTHVRLARAYVSAGKREESLAALREAKRIRPAIETDPEYGEVSRKLR
ncbi:MAG: tetratricopeptide repeat protein, partial [Planctomycetota bacterium]